MGFSSHSTDDNEQEKVWNLFTTVVGISKGEKRTNWPEIAGPAAAGGNNGIQAGGMIPGGSLSMTPFSFDSSSSRAWSSSSWSSEILSSTSDRTLSTSRRAAASTAAIRLSTSSLTLASALRISTDLLSPMLLIQEVSSLYDTAYGVLNDLLALRDELR